MDPEIRIQAQGFPEEEYRKLPYLLKWVMIEGVSALRMAQGGEPVDILLIDREHNESESAPNRAAAAGAQEIPAAGDPSGLEAPESGLTYPLRVADLQRCLQQAIATSSKISPSPAAPSSEANGAAATVTGNPEPGPGASNVERLVKPLLDPQPGSDLRLKAGQDLAVMVSPDRGFQSPLSPREFARLQADLSQAEWQPVAQDPAPEGDDWQPLTRLIWLLAYYGARDGLLPRIPRDRTFTLAGWPDYQVIPMEANNLKVWAYLKWNATDADTIAEATGVDRGQVLGSLNAGYLCGQVRLGEAAEGGAPSTAERPASAGLLGMIRKRLGLQPANPQESAT